MARLTLRPYVGTRCCVSETACKRETKAMKAAARSGKPAGYTWRLWNDPTAGTPPRKIQTGSLHTPAWAHEGPAYKRFLTEPDTDAAVARRDRLYSEWLARREAA